VVQIIASGGGEKPLQIAIIPRSGHFTVDLGTMDNINTKLKTLYRFYTKGLSNVGWDKYRSISLRYEGQVVCR
jgi:cell division protein FtsQ